MELLEKIVQRLVHDDYGGSGSRHNVIYFDGWDGLGASAVLRAVGERLSAGPEFSQVIHIDCSKWESRRAMQRALAEKLQLPAPVMEMFDVQDEEDNYKGGARAPATRYPRGFRLYPRTKVNGALESTGTSTDAVLSASGGPRTKILRWEAEEAARSLINIGGIDWPAAATDCFLYMMRLCGMSGHLVDYDLATHHGCNYWICDGIIQQQQQQQQGDDDCDADTLWLSSDALKHEMRLDADYHHQSPHLPSPVASHLHELIPYWTSPRYGSMMIPMVGEHGRVPQGMFQQYDKLCVLKLSACMFSFTSPPFLCCHNLRFLWLDHCRDDESSSTDDGVGSEEDVQRCFQRLWVLDVRNSSSKILSEKMMDLMTQLRELHVMGQVFDMGALQGRLHNIRKLRVTKSHHDGGGQMIMFSGKEKMELLDFSRNSSSIMMELSMENTCSSLETVIIDGLNLTGTAVETLDLSAVKALKLDELFLLGSGTTQKEATTDAAAGSSRRSSSHAGFDWYICVRDARLLGSLEPVKDYFGAHEVRMEISTTTAVMPPPLAGSKKDVVKSDRGQQQAKYHATYHAIGMPQQEQITDGPPAPPVSPQGCYMHIQDNQQKTHATAAASHIMTAVPGFICDGAKTLHVHDSLFATAAPVYCAWNQLEWCRVERCPSLEHVFRTDTDGAVFSKLRTMCASHLLNARVIFWKGGVMSPSAFKDLTLLQLYGCPRLMHVFYAGQMFRLQSLDTLEIMWCGDLRRIIFCGGIPNLKRIHLHELPKLQAILNVGMEPRWSPPTSTSAPMLKTVKIRGCWSLRELPRVGTNYKVECDCEKEWWDGLKRYSTSHLDDYKPKHPRHYKKTMLRASVLR
ncbi:hypothetical protein U9M48_004871 [Paspalum notatum var. saurae]|uniref:Disease resistance protein At4g27190-like leucine-rich repeats domain-containing protein n=1 Tax=Paspalum notatum var. saurae TaxID=547442 RepID=A0AAQ3PQW9_PASNO